MEALARLARANIPEAEAEHRQLAAALALAEGRTGEAMALAGEAATRFAENSQHLRGAVAVRAAGRPGWKTVFRGRWVKALAPVSS